jgi:hypothetical protein
MSHGRAAAQQVYGSNVYMYNVSEEQKINK